MTGCSGRGYTGRKRERRMKNTGPVGQTYKKESGGRAEEAQLSTILESIADGVFTVDREWRIRSFNRAAERITGVPRRPGGRPEVL